MPLYEFQDDRGEIHQFQMTMEEFDRRVVDDEITLSNGEKARYYYNPRGMSTVPANYPMVSYAAGVHPGQIKQQMDYLRQNGCGQVNHTSDGDPIFEDKHQRRRVCEALGLFDRNGGYNDPMPKNRTANVRKMR